MKHFARISTVITASLLLMMLATISASAQYRYRLSERQVREIGYRNGYQYGIREGRFESRSGRRFDPKDCRAYRDGRWGYRDEYHHDGNYRDGFRNGFLAGYREGFNGGGGYWGRDNDRWDRNDRWGRRDDDWWRRDGRRNNPWW